MNTSTSEVDSSSIPSRTSPPIATPSPSEAGWTIPPIDQYQFDFLNAQGQGWRQVARPEPTSVDGGPIP